MTGSQLAARLASASARLCTPMRQHAVRRVSLGRPLSVAATAKAAPPADSAPRRRVEDSQWTQYVAHGASGISRALVHASGQRVKLSWADGHESEFSSKWLRDHCTEALNPSTKQRELDTFAVPNEVQVVSASVTAASLPTEASSTHPHRVLRLRWNADPDHQGNADSTMPVDWLRRHCTSAVARDLRRRFGAAVDVAATCQPTPVLWGAGVFSGASDSDPPCMEYGQIVGSDEQHPSESSSCTAKEGVARLTDLIRSHGIALVRGVPTNEAGTEALALKIGHLRSTLYGPGMWATSVEKEAGEEGFLDSAYSNDALASHTDCAYLADPPGLQVFNCAWKAKEGGASIYVDGFAVAERLRVEHPEAFDFFSRTSLSYQCFDLGCHYVAEGPIFRLGEFGQVVQMRHNDYDRAPLDYLSNDDIDRFYEYHKPLSAIIRDPSMVARILLEPGDTVILNNHRATHGREAFKGRRRMVGCYIGLDELESIARVHGK